MEVSIAIVAIRLFLRLLLGLILLSTGISKLTHPAHFRRAIQDYRVLPPAFDAKFALSRILATSIPIAEVVTGLGLVSGLLLLPLLLLTILLFLVFCGALMINLARGRYDLSCHCAGLLGNHRISWWLIVRNGACIAGLLVLIFTPADTITVPMLLHHPSLLSTTIWLNVLFPVALLVGVILVMLLLYNAARLVWNA
jgi:uncharacterized membrane protein YphA (DoxX/SURF4 family)